MKRVGATLWVAALAVGGAAVATPRSAAALEPTVEQFTLENGLRVYVRPIPGAKGAFAQLLYTIGEQDDPPGQSGLARLMAEVHATARAGDVLLALNHAIGPYGDGRHEVEVHDDYTAFCEGGSADSFRAVLQELALRMGDLRITVEDVERAKQLMASVYGGGDLNGTRTAHARALSAARDAAHERLRPLPGGGRRGGIREEAWRISVDAVRERWRRFYKPANAILAIAGNVDPALVRQGVRRQFGSIPAGERLPPASAIRAIESARMASLDADDLDPDGVPSAGRDGPVQASPSTAHPLAACLSIVAPPPSDPRGLAAALVLVTRFQDLDPAPADDTDRFRRLLSDLVGETQPRAVYQPMVDSGAIDFVWAERDMPDGEATIAKIRSWLEAAANKPVTGDDLSRVREDPRLGPRLVSADAEEEFPCEVALGIARRAQLGIDGQRVIDEVPQVTVDDLRSVASAASARAVGVSRLANLVAEQRKLARVLSGAAGGRGTSWPGPGETRAVGAPDGVVVREEPKPLGRRVAIAPVGTLVRILEVRSWWVRVESVAEPHVSGWMRASDLAPR